MSSAQDVMSSANSTDPTNPQLDSKGWTALDDPRTRYLAAACIRRGQPVVEVAQVLGVCAATLQTMLGEAQR